MTLGFAANGDEYLAITARADALGVSVSTYIREMALHGGLHEHQARRERAALIHEVNRVGVNLMQSLRLSHIEGRPDPSLREAVLDMGRIWVGRIRHNGFRPRGLAHRRVG